MAYLEPKEHFISADQEKDLSKALTRGTISLPTYLFGCETTNVERCNLISRIATVLESDFRFPPPLPSHVRPMLLDGHPLRVLGLDDAASLASSTDNKLEAPLYSRTIPCLRDSLNQAQSSKSNGVAFCGQRLGEALLRRFWNLCHEDDLHEAIWVLFDALNTSNSSEAYLNRNYRTLEILLDLGIALFFRYQLLRLSIDLDDLRMVLGQQRDLLQSPELGWIWVQSGPEGSSDMVLYRSAFLSRTMPIGSDHPGSIGELHRHKKYYLDQADFHVVVSSFFRCDIAVI